MTTDFLELTELIQNQAQPHIPINTSMRVEDAAIGGQISINFTEDDDYSITTTGTPAQWQYAVIRFTDTDVVLTTGQDIIWPDTPRRGSFVFQNATAQTLTVKRTGQTGEAVAAGTTTILRDNGTDVVAVIDIGDFGGTTVGENIVTMPNPSAVTFIRINADNTVSTRTPSQVRTDLSLSSADSPTFTGLTLTASATFAGFNSSEVGVIDVSSASPALRLTQRGSGYVILMEDDTTPDATPFALTATGMQLVGDLTARNIGGSSGIVAYQQYATTGSAGASYTRYSNNASGTGIYIGKSRATTLGGTGVVADLDLVAQFRFAADDGTDVETTGATWTVQIDGTPASNVTPMRHLWQTMNSGGTLATRMSLSAAGLLNIASTQASTSTTTGALTVAGGLGVAGSAWIGGSINAATGVNDTNGNEVLIFTTTASAVNELTIANAATGNAPTITASGANTDVSMNLVPKGAGTVQYGGIEVGFRAIPQNAQTGNYTTVLADSGKHIFHNSGDGAGDTYTIPANASVAYPLGTTLTFVNRDANTVSIAITSDTMYLGGTTTTGSRTLAENGVATAIKVASTVWIISGSGLT